jgi:hypothetical protein
MAPRRQPAIIPDRVIPISLGVRGDKAQTDRQLRHALNVLEREGYRAGPTSDEAVLAMAKEIEMRKELGLESGAFGQKDNAEEAH